AFNTSSTTVQNVRTSYGEKGLNATLNRKKRDTPPVEAKVTGEVEAHIAPRHIASRDGLQEARRTDTYLPPTAKNGHVLPHTLQGNMVISVGLFVNIANG
ncbi:MAG: hypothetical protein PUE06_06815, partial [Bacteroidales bacterium]|nr:hypothetical protein [Bacteroidales bacterium]